MQNVSTSFIFMEVAEISFFAMSATLKRKIFELQIIKLGCNGVGWCVCANDVIVTWVFVLNKSSLIRVTVILE